MTLRASLACAHVHQRVSGAWDAVLAASGDDMCLTACVLTADLPNTRITLDDILKLYGFQGADIQNLKFIK